METVLDKEKHQQQVEVLKQQNKITEEKLAYLKDMERKLRQMVIEWKKAEDKDKSGERNVRRLFLKRTNNK